MKLTRKKRSKIWKMHREDFQSLVSESSSYREVLIKLGMNPSCGNYKTLNARLQEENICIETINSNRLEHFKNLAEKNVKALTSEEIFVEGREVNRRILKRHLLNLGTPYECDCCKCSTWQDKPLSLQLDHINGINDDNRIENLRFLCPNCHSQTPTFSGKNRKSERMGVEPT